MCAGCWMSNGHPVVYNDRVAQAVDLINALYRVAPTGGPLHVVVDDWNVEDGDLKVYQAFRHDGSPWYSDEVMSLARQVSELMRAMGVEERLSTLAHQEGFLADGRPTAVGTSYLDTHRLHLTIAVPADYRCTCLPGSS